MDADRIKVEEEVEVELSEWATEWVQGAYVDDEGELRESKRRLIVVEAETAEAARRETGLIDHVFLPASDDQLRRWRERALEGLSDEDVIALRRLLAKEQRSIARSRAKDYALRAGLTSRGMNAHVLTPAGLAELRARGGVQRGNEPQPLIDLLVRDGIPANHDSPDHRRARLFAEMQGTLRAIEEEE